LPVPSSGRIVNRRFDQGGEIVRIRALVVAAALILAPPGARAADLVVWWEEGFYPQEDEAVAEIVAAFGQETGKQVELTHYSNAELPDKLGASLEAGQPPDFAFGTRVSAYISEWAFDDRLVDLTDTVGHFSDLFDPDALAWWMLLNQKTGQSALYALPMGRTTNHVQVWNHCRGHPQGVGCVLGVLVRRGAAGGAPGHGSRQHLGRGCADVG
jgi:ABC-type glycerol-3-phosphate transport system substrate-binding protein